MVNNKSRSRSGSGSRSKIQIRLSRSTNKNKKFTVVIEETLADNKVTKKTIHFGAAGMSDYTIHKDFDRMKRYENRHSSSENWNKSGLRTAGFWSKWILWNKPSFMASVRDTEKRFGIKIKLNIKEV